MINDGRLTGYRIADRLIRVDQREVDALVVPYGGAVNGSGGA
jgi:hypothetical protein